MLQAENFFQKLVSGLDVVNLDVVSEAFRPEPATKSEFGRAVVRTTASTIRPASIMINYRSILCGCQELEDFALILERLVGLYRHRVLGVTVCGVVPVAFNFHKTTVTR